MATTYGVTYTPDTYWTVTGGLEAGRVMDKMGSDYDRFAPSFGVTYKDEDRLSANLKLEARFEDSEDNKRDQTSYYFAGGVAVKTSEDWRLLANVDAQAHLGIVRADFHVVRNWDAMLEGRVLFSPTADTTDWGALAAVYRHFGDNVKVGVGYNFGVFSDDLRDLTKDDQGVLLNVLGKF